MKLQVFLSSKMRRNVLRAERGAAQRAIESIELWRCWNWEHSATAGPYPPMDLCLDEVKKSDALVLVLGRDLTAHTRQEYELAANLSIRRYVFVKEGGSFRTRDSSYRTFRLTSLTRDSVMSASWRL